MRLRKVVETLWEISRPTARRATAKTIGRPLPTPLKLRRNQQKSSQVSLLTFPYIYPLKIDAVDSLSHRQIRSEVYTRLSVSNLRFYPTKEVSNGPTGTSR